MSSHVIAMLDLGDTLITLGLEAKEMVSKRLVCLMALMISSWVSLLLLDCIKGMSMTFK